jgi:tRNA nucleotidyltransferase/poly(A) polymerase
MEMFEVGGCVRDELLGVKSKDIDFSVVLSDEDFESDRIAKGNRRREPFDVMFRELERRGFKIFVSSPKFLTIRARFPNMASPDLLGRERRNLTADFVLARKEGAYFDGRRPDEVEVGTLMDDLRRRDFTVNAMAKAQDGTLIDPFDGQADLKLGLLRCVGNAEDRIREDALRALRALRFSVTKGFQIDSELWAVLESDWLPRLLAAVSTERKREELTKMFVADTEKSFVLLQNLPALRRAVLRDGLWLMPTMKQ